jgi:hypothetical protein
MIGNTDLADATSSAPDTVRPIAREHLGDAADRNAVIVRARGVARTFGAGRHSVVAVHGATFDVDAGRTHSCRARFALAAASTGLTLWLGLNERRRTFTIAAALGANRHLLGGFAWVETGVVAGAGVALGPHKR